MRIEPILLFTCLFAASAAHAEKKIYKCTDANGSSVFSPYPCGAGAQEITLDAAAPSAPVMTMPPASMPVTTTPGPPPMPVVNADIKCIQDARLLRAYPASVNLDMLLQRQAELMRAYASD